MIALLEMPFIAMLRHSRRTNLAIYRVIAGAPSVFADLIASGFRRRDGQAADEPEAAPSEAAKHILTRIITGEGEIPGRMEDGTVDAENLSTWVNEARRLCAERGRPEVGDIYIGQLLAKAPSGPDGIWPCEPVRELLDGIGSTHIGEGLVDGKINLGGETTRGIIEGGSQEHALTDIYLNHAAALRTQWPNTADLLRQIAECYQRMGSRQDREADERDQFGF